MNKYTFNCLCGAVAYQVNGELGPVVNCHCSICRKWQGSAYRTRTSVQREQFEIIQGADNITYYNTSDNIRRAFCKTCGCKLHSEYKNKPDVIGLPMGGIEGDFSKVQPGPHVFMASKADWDTSGQGELQFDEWPK